MSKERRLSRIFAKDGKSVTWRWMATIFPRKQMVLIIR
jgi:hypothetical protein